MHEAGFPEGVINFVTGGARTVGTRMVTAPEVRAVWFTGSTSVGVAIQRQAAQSMTKTQLEMGGKNAIVVLADADLDAAAEATVVAAYTCAGQWCTAMSRLIAEQSIHDDLLARVIARARRLELGDGAAATTFMGPVCGSAQAESIMRLVHQVDTGFTHVNLMTAYREPQHPFGGVKMSGFGLPEAGSSGIEFFTEHKAVYVKR